MNIVRSTADFTAKPTYNESSIPSVIPMTPSEPLPARLAILMAGALSPPTAAHAALLVAGVRAMKSLGHCVVRAVFSPVGDAYSKPGLAPACDRIEMCRLLCQDIAESNPDLSDTLFECDSWEAEQPTATRTLIVLQHLEEATGIKHVPIFAADVVKSMMNPKIWNPWQVRPLLARYHVLCAARPGLGLGPEDVVAAVKTVQEFTDVADNVHFIPSLDEKYEHVSSTAARAAIANGTSLAGILTPRVQEYIIDHKLYKS